MKAIKHILTCGGIALVISSCASNLSSPSSSKVKTSASSSASERAIAERVFSLVNSERGRAGKRALRGHRGLNYLAQKHINQLHSMPHGVGNYSGAQSRGEHAHLKYNIENLSEMIYVVPSGSGDPASVAVAAWRSSSDGRKNMLQSWDLTGIGVSVSGRATYVMICMGVRPMGVPRSIQPVGW